MQVQVVLVLRGLRGTAGARLRLRRALHRIHSCYPVPDGRKPAQHLCVVCVCVCVCVCVYVPSPHQPPTAPIPHSSRTVGLAQLASDSWRPWQTARCKCCMCQSKCCMCQKRRRPRWAQTQASGHTKQVDTASKGTHKPLPWLRSRYPTPRSGACVLASERACMCTRMCVCVCVRISYVRARTDASRTHARASTHARTHARTHAHTHTHTFARHGVGCRTLPWSTQQRDLLYKQKRPTQRTKEHTANKRDLLYQVKRPTLQPNKPNKPTLRAKET